MTTNPSSFNSNNDDPINNQNDPLQQASTSGSTGDPVMAGYMLVPAKIIIELVVPPNVNVMNNFRVDIKDVNFIGPDIDFLYQEVKELKEHIKKLVDTKQLSQDIGNELVGETYLRWDTQVRFYPTIVFIFLETEEDFIKRSILDKSQYRKKVQIKLRVTHHSIEKFENDESFLKRYIVSLKDKIQNLMDIYNFHAGNLKCTYVNQGRVSWKTTIFATNKNEAILILTRLCNLIDEVVDPKMFTCSNVRSSNEQEADILVYLHKVSLLINKKKYPIVLYHV